MTVVVRPPISLDDRYRVDSGRVLLTGVQALVRLFLEQRSLDRHRGLNTGLYVSGYPGSPLGGLDKEIHRAATHLRPAGVVFQPGVNEELAATAVAGTQLLEQLPNRRYDGVVGFWYGKNPGLDRAADAIRHGNVSGTAHVGGAVALIGDDPQCKSSTLPSSCEPMCRSLTLPLLSPSSVQEIIELGLHAVAMSRFSGAWTALKIGADLADATAAVELESLSRDVPPPPAHTRGAPPALLAPTSVSAEHDLLTVRMDRARAYAREHKLNRVVFEPTRPRLGIVAHGMTYASVQRALADLGLGPAELDGLGIRLVQLRMPWPLAREDALAFAAELDDMLVVEDKAAFVESQLTDALYRVPGAPRILGKLDANGSPLLTEYGAIGAGEVVGALARVLAREALPADVALRLDAQLERRQLPGSAAALPSRTPFFCSGCPHNISTKAAPDQLVGAGIGCHALVSLDPARSRGNIVGAPQMGGEGAHWLGLSPFTDDSHFVQNIGDGTFHHSGSLSIRAAAAAGVTMTFKLLYNSAVAMTGGQQPEGRLSVPDLTRWLALEGARRVVVTTPEPEAYRGLALDPVAEVRHRDELAAVEAELAAQAGLTVIIHDDRCATEERRMRKRGRLAEHSERVWINERVCEGCGDCGAKSSCLSVLPVETEFGRKTQIHQSSCNSDLSCLRGDCPAFVLVKPGPARKRTRPPLPLAFREPTSRLAGDGETLLRLPGVGGTGVVTVSQVLMAAATFDGRWAAGLDQTGLAQKGGPVVSDVRLGQRPVEGAARASAAADVLLGFDTISAARPETLSACDPNRTIAVLNTTLTPTAAMVVDVRAAAPDRAGLRRAVEAVTRAEENLYIDATGLSEALFGDHLQANVLLLGAAYQHGCIPIGADAIRQAIEANGSAVERNLAAFDWGRAAAISSDAVWNALMPPSAPSAPEPWVATLLADAAVDPALEQVLAVRISDLAGYQNRAYARRYLETVMTVQAAEHERVGPHACDVAVGFARGLHRLMAYKDEYEVARLHLLEPERTRLQDAFGSDARVKLLLHPPALRAMGMQRKLAFGAWFRPALYLLRGGRRLRGRRIDPFGRSHVRQVERSLVQEYTDLVRSALDYLAPGTVGEVVRVVELADLVRGYEEIKLANVRRFRRIASERLTDLEVAQPSAECRDAPT